MEQRENGQAAENKKPTTIDKIAWIRVERGRVLSARSKGKEIYYFPGGKREPGESDVETLAREIEEELSVRIKPETAKLFGVFEAPADGKADGITVRMTCYCADYEGELTPAAEIEELAWLENGDRGRISAASRLVFDAIYGSNEG
ncbi:NUDIX hydrolase [Saccharibacillus alkalitolerans]|uniref:NUDIX domain-containing protein n=1 Tax=Saccharibacillus alkalitolerans TaxID=2705290 RepID=A0ABX0F4A1_9BACL|nr:NUDIX domain-containing protein [Saccharibacillus alkalitolerans]NGZ74734.1 NUDIX domain-containing protein [Saccharibacillus alkalitolerans]